MGLIEVFLEGDEFRFEWQDDENGDVVLMSQELWYDAQDDVFIRPSEPIEGDEVQLGPFTLVVLGYHEKFPRTIKLRKISDG